MLSILLSKLEGFARKEESKSFWRQQEQYFEAIEDSGHKVGEKFKDVSKTCPQSTGVKVTLLCFLKARDFFLTHSGLCRGIRL